MTYRRKRVHKGIKDISKKYRAKRKTKDLDQIHEDLKVEKLSKILLPTLDGDLPGAGAFYCVHCARHFINADSLNGHLRSKVHKRRVRDLKDEPYTVEEAHSAAGMGQYEPRKKMAVPNVTVCVEDPQLLKNPEAPQMAAAIAQAAHSAAAAELNGSAAAAAASMGDEDEGDDEEL